MLKNLFKGITIGSILRRLFGSIRLAMVFLIVSIFVFLIPKDGVTFSALIGCIGAWLFAETKRKTQ